jgi:hypothetical protein
MIVLVPVGGLANRMRAISSGYQLTNDKSEKLFVLWEQNHELNCRFEELFDAIPNVIFIQSSIAILYYKKFIKFFFSKKELLESYKTREDIKKNNYSKFYLRTCNQFYGNYQDLSMFRPHDKFINEAKKLVNNDLVIGIHIRMTDNSISIKNSPTYLFDKVITDEIKLNNDIKFYLSTDDSEVEELFLKKYTKFIIVRKKERNRNSPTGIKDALVDFIALSFTSKIYGSYFSSFGAFASIFGNKQFIILKNED